MAIIARFFPNGEFSHGVDTSHANKERRHKERRHEPLDPECRDTYLQWKADNPDMNLCVPGQSYLDESGERMWVYTGVDKDGVPMYDALDAKGLDVHGIRMEYPIGRLIGSGRFSPLVHQLRESSPNEVKEPSRKRLTGMTKNMARNIRNACYLLDAQYGKDNISFLTLTLPNLSTDELGLCCEKWDYMIDQFLKWLRKRSQKLNIPFAYVYATEIQLKRLQKRKEYAPHLHLAFRGRNAKKSPWMVTPKQVRKAWTNIICNVIGHRQFDNRALENLQRVRKSVARYLAKYLSKGGCTLPSDSGTIIEARLHTQWGGMARVLSRAIKSCTIRLSGASSCGGLVVHILRHMGELIEKGLVRYHKTGEIVIRPRQSEGVERFIKVGVGCLQRPTYEGGLSSVASFVQGLSNGRSVNDALSELYKAVPY